ncbi:hypothetical protein LCGC14_0512390 [marine sediment metagenome]|uniref:SpoVT-AbrB domain-containing protein n=1 Tax=marine sediment metagenome TaxID=412755 RepID=A0A0F9SJD1_9ZZZZ|nr:MAG: hypothetical protein Lokiarch_42750 [Candidatus Lokiarchaeum sp. GC14_75]
MVFLKINTEIRKVDSQGRIVLPLKWRERELKNGEKVLVIEDEGILKIIPQKKIDLTQFFDSLEFDEDLIEKLEDWSDFENYLLNKKFR